MAAKFFSKQVKQTSYLSGYLILLVYTLSGFMFKGEIWLLVGAFCWLGIVSSYLISYIYRYKKKRLLKTILKAENLKSEKLKPNRKGDESNSSFGFEYW